MRPKRTEEYGLEVILFIQVSMCRVNALQEANFAQAYTFNCLTSWAQTRRNATRQRLHQALVEASEDGLITRTDLSFLLEPVRSVL